MVFSAESEKERLPKLMAMGTERSKLLHNFTLPCLKWGSQRHLRCMKVNSAGSNVSSADRLPSASKLENFFASERRKSKSERREFLQDSEKRLRVSKSGIGRSGDYDGDDGIEAIGRKLLLDLKTTADNLKNTMLREEMVEEAVKENDDVAETPTAAPAMVEEKPWNLRTRRGASKAPIGNVIGIKAALKTDERKSDQNSPASNEGDGKWPRPKAGIEKREKPKFSVSLSKKEIEEDFIAMSNRRPPRRPRKRPRAVQKQMDMIFPGLWLSEITADSYKVSENQENPKAGDDKLALECKDIKGAYCKTYPSSRYESRP